LSNDTRTRLLKLGVTVGSEFLYRAYFVAPSMVTVGTSEKATLRIQDEAVPEDHELFSIQPDSCLLQFKRDMNLAFLYDGLFRRPNFLIDEGLAFRRGRNYVLNLETRARGTLNFGATRILFKLEVTDRPSLRRIPLPEFEGQSMRCAACGEQLQNVLAAPGAVTRCDFCKSLNRFEGLTGEVGTAELPAEPDTAAAEESSVEESSMDEVGSPLLLTRPISTPERATTTSMEERNTVLDAGVIHQDPGGPSKVHMPTPSLPGEPDQSDPSSPAQISEKETLVTSSIGLRAPDQDVSATSAPTALPPVIAEPVEPIPEPIPPLAPPAPQAPELTQRMPSGERLQTLSDPGVAPARAQPHWQPPPPVSNELPAAPGLQSGGAVPVRVQRRRHRSAFSSAPHAAIPEPRESGQVSDSYTSSKLADRLTLLIVTLALIALLLAAILGALLMQGAMRRWTAQAPPPPEETEVQADADAGAGDLDA
jgi:hypothetical protein